jgi:hypothetical protein
MLNMSPDSVRTIMLKVLAGYNYETLQLPTAGSCTEMGLIYENAQDINLALGQSITTGGGMETWAILGGFYRLNYGFKDRYLLELNGRYDGSSKFPSERTICVLPIGFGRLARIE